MQSSKLKTKILVDGGDPEETFRVKHVLGFVDGQTTNPSLIAKNPEIQRRIASGHTLSAHEENDAYRKIVQAISPLVGDVIAFSSVFRPFREASKGLISRSALYVVPCTTGTNCSRARSTDSSLSATLSPPADAASTRCLRVSDIRPPA